MVLGRGDRLRQAIIEKQAVWQISQVVMPRQVRHFRRYRLRLRDVVKNHDGAGHAPSSIMDGRGGIFDRGLGSVAPDQFATEGQFRWLVFLYDQHHGIDGTSASGNVNNSKYVFKRPADRLLS